MTPWRIVRCVAVVAAKEPLAILRSAWRNRRYALQHPLVIERSPRPSLLVFVLLGVRFFADVPRRVIMEHTQG